MSYYGERGAGAVLYFPKSQEFGFGLRSGFVNEPGTIGVFGGAVDPGESHLEALERELAEELAFVMPIFSKDLFKYKDGDFEYHNYVVVVDEDYFMPVLNGENEEIVRFTMEELLSTDRELHFGVKAILSDTEALQSLKDFSNLKKFDFESFYIEKLSGNELSY